MNRHHSRVLKLAISLLLGTVWSCAHATDYYYSGPWKYDTTGTRGTVNAWITIGSRTVGAHWSARYTCPEHSGGNMHYTTLTVTSISGDKVYVTAPSLYCPGAVDNCTCNLRSGSYITPTRHYGLFTVTTLNGSPCSTPGSYDLSGSNPGWPGGDPPSAPTGLASTAQSKSQILVTWQDNSGSEDGYKLDRRLSGATDWVRVFTSGPNVESRTDGSLTASTKYYYKVKAYNENGNSAYSNVDDATTQADVPVPSAPSGLVATAQSGTEILVTWQDNSSDEDGFKLDRRQSGTTPWERVFTSSAGVESRTDAGLSLGTKYYYKVKAYNAGGDSAYSSIDDATTLAPPAAPSACTASALSSTEISVGWTDNSSDEQSFKVDRRESGTTDWVRVFTSGPDVESCTDSGLAPSTKYYYEVKAYNAAGNSDYSNIADATTPSGVQPEIAVSRTSISVSCEEGQDASSETFDVWNSGTGTLLYQLVEASSLFDLAPATDSSTGSSDQKTHTVTFHTAALAVGLYEPTFTVQDNGSGAENGPITVTLHITVVPPPSDPEWPQWRGPNRDGTSPETGWLVNWPPAPLWSKSVGQGWSAPVISEGRLYTMGNADDQDTVLCLDAVSGEELWSQSYDCDEFIYNGPRATPVVDGDELYTFSWDGQLKCFDKSTGTVLWSKTITAGRPGYGYGGSPLVLDDRIILNAGGAGTAVDRNAPHDILWSSGGTAGYASPVLATVDSQPVVVLFAEDGVYGVNPQTGATNWWSLCSGEANIADPVVHSNKLFISSEAGPAALLELGSGELSPASYSLEMYNNISSAVRLGDDLYGWHAGSFACFDMTDGTAQWTTTETFEDGGVIAADGKLIALSGDGKLIVLNATTTGWDPEGRAVVTVIAGADGENWYTPPALCDGRIYCRGENGTLVALSCRDEREPATFEAYNDLRWISGQTQSNITIWTTGDTGALVDYATGTNTPMTLSVTGGDPVDNGAMSDPGTDGYDVFNGKVDCVGVIQYSAEDLVLNFSADAIDGQRYEVFVFGNRDNAAYTDRISKMTISGADSFVNASSTGTLAGATDADTTIVHGYNTENGYVARYTDIDAGADGTFVITVSDGGSADPPRFYANAVMVRAYAAVASDTDGDGLPDAWESEHFANATAAVASGNPDGDALSNEQEFILGTDPNVIDVSWFDVAVGLSGGQIQVSFQTTEAGGEGYDGMTRCYTLEGATCMGSAWQPITGFENIAGTGQTVTCPAVDGTCVYRAKVWLVTP